MGYGDEIMGSGMARGAKDRGKRIAFGDGKRIIWSPQAHEIFQRNPNVARPSEEGAGDLEWIEHYRGHRRYHTGPIRGCAKFNDAFRPIPGEIFFDDRERDIQASTEGGFVLVEPHVKTTSPNKQWPHDKWQMAVNALLTCGYDVAQLSYGRGMLDGARPIKTKTFREGLAVLSRAAIAITTEGGLHHGAACFQVPAVVLFGGHTLPATTGYDGHVNLFVGHKACGMGSVATPCEHCRASMQQISVDLVVRSTLDVLERK